MVKLTQTRKFNYENLSGGKISLEITKNGASVVIVIKQDYASALWSNKISFMTEMLALVFIYMFFDRRIVFLCIFVMCVLIIYQLNVVQEESIIMIKSLGYQITTKYFLWGQRDLFISMNQVQNVFINEVILRWKVVYVLTLLVENDQRRKLIPLFLEIIPRLQCLEIIYRHLKSIS